MGLLNVVNIGVVFEPICFHKKENAMNFVGIDLHKQTISVCVVSQERKVSARRTFRCAQPDGIRAYFATLSEFQAVIEATVSYEWLWVLLEPLADGRNAGSGGVGRKRWTERLRQRPRNEPGRRAQPGCAHPRPS